MNLIAILEQEEIARLNKTIPVFAPGDTVIVNVNVVEGTRKRVQREVGAHQGKVGLIGADTLRRCCPKRPPAGGLFPFGCLTPH